MPMSDPRVPPRRHRALRRGVFALAEGAARALGGRALYRRLHLAPGRFRVREERIAVPGLAPELRGFCVAQLSDLHAGPFLGPGDLGAVMEAVEAARPDLLAITGDLCAHGPEDAARVLDDLATVGAPCGSWAVFGNHDYRGRREAGIAADYAARGITFLRNEGRRLVRDGRELPMVITGLEDLEEGRHIDPEAARAGLREGDLELMLCHNPRGARALARPGCAAILAGHTHGTQIDLPWLRHMGPDHPGLRVEYGPTTLIVSCGLGVVGAPLRVRVPAELVLIRFEAAPTEGKLRP